jgi:hypothetical protein
MIVSWRKGVPQEAIDAFPGRKHLRAIDFMRQASLGIKNLAGCNVNAKLVRREAKSTQPRDELLLRDNPGAAPGKFGLDPFIDIGRPTGPPK